jgi:hypothetical protein
MPTAWTPGVAAPSPPGPTLVLLDTRTWSVIGRTARLGERVSARLHAAALDRVIADGRRPDSAPLLELRAVRLLKPRQRRSLAKDVRHLVDEAMRPTPAIGRSASPISRARVRGAAEELQTLADLVAAPVPVSARAVAGVRVLLTDAASPLFRTGSSEELRARARYLCDQLDPHTDW